MTLASPAPAPPSPEPRRIAAPRWLDLRLVLGVALVLASVLLGARVVSGARHTYPTVTARRDLAAGTVLGAGDLRVAQVQLPGHGTGVYLARLRDAVGKQLRRPVAAGELVPVAAVADARPLTTVTVPLEAAAAPDLRKGERIELWVSSPACPSTVLLRDVTVQAVHDDTSNTFGAGSGAQDVVISVAPALADRVIGALAITDVKLRAGVLQGAAAPSPAASGGTDPAADPLPDLGGCADKTSGR